MSPLARALLALAAAALLHAGTCFENCITVEGGKEGAPVFVLETHLDQTNNLIDLPEDSCGWSGGFQVGVKVTACDPFGRAPTVQLLDNDSRAQISCTWTEGQMCPRGLDVIVTQKCYPYVDRK